MKNSTLFLCAFLLFGMGVMVGITIENKKYEKMQKEVHHAQDKNNSNR